MKRCLHLVAAAALTVFPAVAFAQPQTTTPEHPAPGMTGHDMGGMAMPGMSDASKAYMDAMKKMDAPMMEALQSPDPDVAFVAGMIPLLLAITGSFWLAKSVTRNLDMPVENCA